MITGKDFIRFVGSVLAAAILLAGGIRFARAQPQSNACGSLPSYYTLKSALAAATAADKSGLNNQLWATLMDHDGLVCAVVFSGVNRLAQPLAGRVFSAQKANTANGYSTDGTSFSNGSGQPSGLAQSSANLYTSSQPGGILWGYQADWPIDPAVANAGPSSLYGAPNDPMVGNRIGGINLTGGGLALYDVGHVIVGGVGVSGDTPCRDHNIAWLVRHNLNLDHMAGTAALPAVAGPAALFAGDVAHPDNIIFDITPNKKGGTGISKSGFGHPQCPFGTNPLTLPPVQP